MSHFPLNLDDLVPKEAVFKLSTYPDKEFTLERWSLYYRQWAVKKWTSAGLQEILKNMQVGEISELAFFMLKDKPQFNNSQDDFFKAISTTQDQINIVKALLTTIGIGEPEFKKVVDSMKKATGGTTPDPKPTSPKKNKKKIGAKSSTP